MTDERVSYNGSHIIPLVCKSIETIHGSDGKGPVPPDPWEQNGNRPELGHGRHPAPDVRFGSRSYGDGGKGLAPLSLCENRWRCPHDPS
jgi:hypothetical protein